MAAPDDAAEQAPRINPALLRFFEGLPLPEDLQAITETRGREDPCPHNSIVDLVAGTFATQVGQIWRGERIKEYLTATDARRHVWHAWLSSESMAFQTYGCMGAELAYHRLTYVRSGDLISQAYGRRPPGITKALGRLGASARRPEVYRALVRVLKTEGGAAKLLRHSKELEDEVILGLARLPPGLEASCAIALLKDGRIGANKVGFLAWTLGKLKEVKGPDIERVVLSAPKPLEALWDAMQDLPFPEPPWAGTDLLKPVTSKGHLLSIAKRLDNCLTNPYRRRLSMLEVFNGSRCFYAWCGETPALLEFRRLGSLGWVLKDARGYRNKDLPEKDWDEIVRLLADVPAVCTVWAMGWQEAAFDGFLPMEDF